ncbi:pig-H [Schizosaccharomyces cryophilus OY26]|uniref:Pig-H n=1 Tax=Schizosaccharomyces cryophilus (strain OY26 / ATCC MYA-4695 / CBS 11777 / NBRC 106824 / NRRL Y48691) TaxID=653667 RepID=S9XBG2_SCHCR|nr:pig-H [Schizosaccharomyces cryophilus OY26]EPY51126.1 pig-H [Schizosaccharomyces cryophilus OY26]
MLTVKRYPGATEFIVHTSKGYGTQMFAVCFLSFSVGVTILAFEPSPRLLLWISGAIFILSLFQIISGVNHESLLVVRDLGVQTNCHSIVPWKSSSKLVPLDSVREIFIHEGFRKFDVCYYMGIAIDHEPQIHVVFPTLLPRRDVLQKIYSETLQLLKQET